MDRLNSDGDQLQLLIAAETYIENPEGWKQAAGREKESEYHRGNGEEEAREREIGIFEQ